MRSRARESAFDVMLVVATTTATTTQHCQFDKLSWAKHAERLRERRDQLLGAGHCLVSTPELAEHGGPEEHVIPQGTGIRWIRLPSGLVAAHVNNRASRWELGLLRSGLMGALRPFYLRSKKEITFDDSGTRQITFRNRPGHGFEVVCEGFDDLRAHSEGPGEISFRLPLRYAPSAEISRAVHKVAYLTLAVLRPEIALSPGLSHIRQYLSGVEESYRPFGERFVAGAAPGASVRFDAFAQAESNAHCMIKSLVARVTIHHVEYLVPMDHCITAPQSGWDWHGEREPTGTRLTTLDFRFDAILPTTALSPTPSPGDDSPV